MRMMGSPAPLQSVGLNAEVVDVDFLALGNAFELRNLSLGINDTEVRALVDIGASKTDINIMRGNTSYFQREIFMAGNDLTGRRVTLGDFHGRYVYVNFFASWCVPCQKEQPDLVSFFRRHTGGGDVALLGVVYQDDPALVSRFFAKEGGGWPVIDDPAAKVNFGTTGVPETFLVDPNGIVLKRIVGQVSDAGLEGLLRAAEAIKA